MKIGLIGPGIMPIPPPGWGAVEVLIWDYYNSLTKLGHNVIIINKMRSNGHEQTDVSSVYCRDLINEINGHNFDFVHLHYDCMIDILPHLNCKKKGLTSHYPFIDQIHKHAQDRYANIFFKMVLNNNDFHNFVLASKDIHFLEISGVDDTYLHKLENGIDETAFSFYEKGNKQNKTIYLGKVSQRKKQHIYGKLKNIDIIGPNNSGYIENYCGSWTRDQVHSELSHYGNLLLLSDGEADPLVVKEALIAGLGVVLNETSAKNLEKQSFITIIPNNKLMDLDFIQQQMEENRNVSIQMRDKIREYGIEHFSWNNLIKDYINIIEHM